MKQLLIALVVLVCGAAAVAIRVGETLALPQTISDSFGKPVALNNNQYKVFYFYPRSNTPGCTAQNIEYSKLLPKFVAANAQVIGVSSDSADTQCDFSKEYKLKVALIPDTKGVLAKLFDVGGLFGFYSRDTVVLAPNNSVVSIRRNVNAVADASETLAIVQKLK